MRAVAAAVAAVAACAEPVGTAVVASAVSFLGVGSGASCPGLPWTLLAAIGTVESDNG